MVSRLNSDYKKNTYRADLEASRNQIGREIQRARKENNWSLSMFSERLESYGVHVGAAALSKWELGKSIPNAYQLLAVCDVLGLEAEFPCFREYEEELNEEGKRKIRDYRDDLIASGKYEPVHLADEYPEIRYIEMPVSYLPASAGTGTFLDEGNFEMIRFPENSVPKQADFGLYVSGDSMEPSYHDGQIVWVEKKSELNLGDVGIFLYDDCGYIKAYSRQKPKAEQQETFTDSYGHMNLQTVLISYNKKYQPIEVSPDTEFSIIGKVLN